MFDRLLSSDETTHDRFGEYFTEYQTLLQSWIACVELRDGENSNTLEWTTPINPEHGNWPGEIPAVYRWPYDYSKPGAPDDFIPQNVPHSATPESNLPEENAEIAREKDIDGLLGAQNESYKH